MNTHRENYTATVRQTMTDISADLAKQDNDRQIAHQSQINAIQVQDAANNQWQASQENCANALSILTEGTDCTDTATNLLDTAQTAADEVALLRTDVGTTAANIKVAAKAISQLSAKMGSAYNIAEATMEGDIWDRTQQANEQIRAAANKAEEALLEVMKASNKTAQIAGAKVFDEITDTHGKFEQISQKSQTQLDELNQYSNQSQQQTIEAGTELKAAKGEWANAEAIHQATYTSLAAINKSLNYNLKAENPTSIGIELSFDSFTLKGAADKKYEHTYHIFAVKAELKDTITMLQIESVFKANKQRFKTVDITDGRYHDVVSFAKQQDINGEDIELGKPYVIFLYIQLDEDYKKDINSYYDLLSAPSNEFTLFKLLPEISFEELEQSRKEIVTKTKTFKFKTKLVTQAAMVQMKVVWLPEEQVPDLGSSMLMSPDWFEDHGTELVLDDERGIFSVEAKPSLYDVYGAKIKFANAIQLNEKYYIPVVLAIVPEEGDKANSYQVRLAELPDKSVSFKKLAHKYYVEVDTGKPKSDKHSINVKEASVVLEIDKDKEVIVSKKEGEDATVSIEGGNSVPLTNVISKSGGTRGRPAKSNANPTANSDNKSGKRGK